MNTNINDGTQGLNLRWSSGEPKQNDHIIKGHLVGCFAHEKQQLIAPYLIDSITGAWLSVDKELQEWARGLTLNKEEDPNWLSSTHLGKAMNNFSYNIFGVSEIFSGVKPENQFIVPGEYYQLARAYAVATSPLNIIKSLALIADEEELWHRWRTEPSNWNHDHPLHPNTLIGKTPPLSSFKRIKWLGQIKVGDRVNIVSPYYAEIFQSPKLLTHKQQGIVKSVGSRLIRVAYISTNDVEPWASGEKKGSLEFSVLRKTGVSGKNPQENLHSWIEEAVFHA